MKNFKVFLGGVLISIAAILILAIDNFSILGIIVSFIVIMFTGRDGIRLISKYSTPEDID